MSEVPLYHARAPKGSPKVNFPGPVEITFVDHSPERSQRVLPPPPSRRLAWCSGVEHHSTTLILVQRSSSYSMLLVLVQYDARLRTTLILVQYDAHLSMHLGTTLIFSGLSSITTGLLTVFKVEIWWAATSAQHRKYSHFCIVPLQGYLAYKKTPSPRTLQ